MTKAISRINKIRINFKSRQLVGYLEREVGAITFYHTGATSRISDSFILQMRH